MHRLAKILCTSICALSLTQIYSDDIGFTHEHEISFSSPLDSSDSLTAFSSDHSYTENSTPNFNKTHSSITSSAKITHKEVAVKPFTGKVAGKKVRLRSQADTDSPIIKELSKGELLTIIAEKGDFWVVEPSKSSKAFVFRSYIIDNVIEGNKVNVRLKPSVDSPVLTHLNSGDKISGVICATNNKWMEISLPSDVQFYVSKQFIENIGSPDVKAKHDHRRQTAEKLLDSNQQISKSEFEKSFPEINFDKLRHAYQTFINEYTEFNDLTALAKEDLINLQESYIEKRLSYVEVKPQLEEEIVVVTELSNSSSILQSLTDKMKLWEPLEESLYLSWSSINENKTLDDYYTEQKLSSAEVSGILEPYNAPVKCKPGDFIIRDKDLPVAYVYSTQINLQQFVGQKVTLKGSPRPNNNFAFPAYYIFSAE
ncbi:MAG: hypothetical protein EBZ47_01340 [Chlamydiae bacterium]|nr:hypothetical protein [Chlamydiota bacterium]